MPLTRNQYDLGEVISALQKEIRRGEEQAALYWAAQLCPEYERYLWKRLLVIINEDIGIANPQLLVYAAAERQIYMDSRIDGKNGSARLALANTILLACRSQKSRLADHFQCAVFHGQVWNGAHLEIPDYALDKHTKRGRIMRRGFDHWLEYGTVLKPEATINDPYRDVAVELWKGNVGREQEWPPMREAKGAAKQMSLLGGDHDDTEEKEGDE